MNCTTCVHGKSGLLLRSLGLGILALALSACGQQADTFANKPNTSAETADRSAPLQTLETPAPVNLDWPPAPAAIRMSSDDFYPLTGVEYIEKGGGTTDSAPSLLFDDSAEMPWAVYGISGFGPDVMLESVEVEFSIDASPPPGTQFYFALSNYARGSWEWYVHQPTSAELFPTAPEDYVSPGGSSYVAIVLSGGGSGQVDSLRFNRVGAGAVAPPPTNLTGTAEWFQASLEWDPVEGATGYNVYRSNVADMTGALRLTTPAITATNYDDTTVASLQTYHYAVKAYRGGASDYSNIVELTIPTGTLDAPTNLVAEATTSNVLLTWDPSDGAVSYNIYRASEPTFQAPLKIGSSLAPTYTDTAVSSALSYFYRVTAVRQVLESDPSNTAFAFIFEVDLPAPTNLHIVSISGDVAVVAWEWEGTPPPSFRAYFKKQENFGISPPFHDVGTVPGDDLDYRVDDLPSGQKMWCRVCALDENNKRGRLTDALEIDVPPYWTMSPPEMISQGKGPVSSITADGDIACTYEYDSTAGSVRFARRSAGSWAVEDIGLETGMGDWIDLASAGGQYMVFTQATLPKDLWCSEGTPGGSWTDTLIQGNGSTALGTDVSGYYISAAASSTDWVVAHIWNDPDIVENGLTNARYHTRPLGGGAWSEFMMREPVDFTTYHCLEALGSEVYALSKLTTDTELLFGPFVFSDDMDNSNDFFDFEDVNPGGNAGAWTDLTRYNGAWWSPSVDSAEGNLQIITDDGSLGAWEGTDIDASNGFISRCSMAANDDHIYVTYLGNTPVLWHLAVYDGVEWKVNKLSFAGVDIGDNVDVSALDGYPFFVCDTREGNTIWGCYGLPPGF